MRYGCKLEKAKGKEASGTYYQTICPSPIGDLTLACDGENLVGLWIEGQKYYGGTISKAMVPKDDISVFAAAKKWLDQYLPEIDSAHCLFVPYGKNKAEFIEAMLHRRLSRADILIDDHTPNLHRWEAAGGPGIKWLNQVNGNNGRFEGARVGSAEELRAVLDNASQG